MEDPVSVHQVVSWLNKNKGKRCKDLVVVPGSAPNEVLSQRTKPLHQNDARKHDNRDSREFPFKTMRARLISAYDDDVDRRHRRPCSTSTLNPTRKPFKFLGAVGKLISHKKSKLLDSGDHVSCSSPQNSSFLAVEDASLGTQHRKCTGVPDGCIPVSGEGTDHGHKAGLEARVCTLHQKVNSQDLAIKQMMKYMQGMDAEKTGEMRKPKNLRRHHSHEVEDSEKKELQDYDSTMRSWDSVEMKRELREQQLQDQVSELQKKIYNLDAWCEGLQDEYQLAQEELLMAYDKIQLAEDVAAAAHEMSKLLREAVVEPSMALSAPLKSPFMTAHSPPRLAVVNNPGKGLLSHFHLAATEFIDRADVLHRMIGQDTGYGACPCREQLQPLSTSGFSRMCDLAVRAHHVQQSLWNSF